MEQINVVGLRCEYRTNPIGLDISRPRMSWKLESHSRSIRQSAYRIQTALTPDFADSYWDSGKVESDRSVLVEYAGPALQPRTRYYFRVKIWDGGGNESTYSETAFWEMGLMNVDGWVADWISPQDETPDTKPVWLLRRTFHLRGNARTARVYATALGLYELQLNGTRIHDWQMTPGWTSYRKRLQYQTYDVTEQLIKGDNAIGVMLGNGWYRGFVAWKDQRNVYGDRRAALVQLHVCYEDGTEEIIASDPSWAAAEGPILDSELYHGETYDARLEKRGWSTAAYNAADWRGVTVLEHSKATIVAQENEPVRVIQELKPTAVIRTPKGETVLDMGQNMVGRIRFTVVGAAGMTIKLQHAEVLDKEGNFYTANLRKAEQTITYVCKGEETETFEPHFTFMGFRYVKVEGYPGKVSADRFVGHVLHSDMEPTGTFECSEPLLNQLQSNILWGQKGNFLDVPTDCPQRDERLGWTGDAQVFIRTAAFNMNVASFFAKWLRDLKADQHPNGGVPFVIPHVLWEKDHSSTAWGDAAVICPWTVYLCYGDVRVLEEQYDSMKAWVEYMRAQGDEELLWNNGFHFGDWLGLDAKENSYVGATPRDLIATAFYAYSTNLVAKTASVLGKQTDAEQYGSLHQSIVAQFNREFVTPRGRLASPTQTAHVLALMFDLVEGSVRKRTVNELAQLIKDNKFHLTTGFVGTPYLCLVLSANGHHEAACKLVLQTTYPSWLYSITKGATTIWEHWDSIKEDGSFWSDNMNSFNHYAYGSIGDWLYRVAAGLDTSESEPGYKRTVIRPQLVEGLSYARATLRSPYGDIHSGWERDEAAEMVSILVKIAPNTTAEVMLPSALAETVTLDGRPLAIGEGIAQFEQAGEGVLLELGSGDYRFVYPYIRS